MNENETTRASIIKVVEQLDKLIQQEANSNQVINMVVSETKRLSVLQEQYEKLRKEIDALQKEKGSMIEKAKAEAEIIVRQAESSAKEAEGRLANIKRLERVAEENRQQADELKSVHQAALSELNFQKSKLRAAMEV